MNNEQFTNIEVFMLVKYQNFLRNIAINRIGKLGVILTTSSFITFLILEFARLSGILTNAYIGLITYLSLPLLFVIGLVLIPIGWFKRKKQTGKSTKELLAQRFAEDATKAGFFGSKLAVTIGFFTLINVLFMFIASTQMLLFMDEPQFCGTACHSVMNPEWVTYQQSPHARVKCVECHVGEGVDALINSKLNGAYQMLSITLNLFEKPIPTPVHQLRPARETCEKCHWPDKFYGARLKSIIHYQTDSLSTPLYTTLNLKIDAGKGHNRAGIHWHVSAENEVRYASVEDEREQMIWVDVKQSDGSFKRYRNTTLSEAGISGERTMDCVDCHNRATHIYENPEYAIDERIANGLMDRSLPFLKRVGLKAITNDYPSKEEGMNAIAAGISGFYAREYPQIAAQKMALVDSAIAALQRIYHRNIHPEMNIQWGSYLSHLGHEKEGGCFRCHNKNMIADEGSVISDDCTLCHSILADQSATPFKYLEAVNEKDRDAAKHRYLLNEFLNQFKD